MMDSGEIIDLKKDIYNRIIKSKRAVIYLDAAIKRDLYTTKEEICAQESLRNKENELDVSKVKDKPLKAAIKKLYDKDANQQFEAEIDMYELIINLIKNEKILLEPINRYADNIELLKEEKKVGDSVTTFAEEQIQNGLISSEDLDLINAVVSMVESSEKEAELEKFNKEIGKEKKDKDLTNKKSIDIDKLNELIGELGLEDQIKIKDN